MLRRILQRQGAEGWFRMVVGGEEVSSPKPHPEGLLRAVDALGAPAERTLYCGDTVIDAETAQRAGVPFAGVLNGTTTAEELSAFPHVYIASDLWALKKFLKL